MWGMRWLPVSKINSDILNPGNLIFRCDWRRYWNLFSGRGRESPGLTHQVPGRGQYWQTPIKKEVNAHLYWVEVRFRPSVGLLQGLISTRAVIDSTGNQLSTQPVWKANRFALVDVLSCNLVEKGHAFFSEDNLIGFQMTAGHLYCVGLQQRAPGKIKAM